MTELRAFASWEEMADALAVPADRPGWRTLPDPIPPGVMWRAPALDRDGREAWIVVLPNGAHWATTEAADGDGDGFGWEVTGEPPKITVNPSIDDQGSVVPWHGWIKDGVMTP